MLWPDGPSNRISHRLSVLLSIVRSTLDPDRRVPTDHYLIADQASVTLDSSGTTIAH